MRAFLLVAATSFGIVGCQQKTIAELSYTEMKQLAGEILQRCIDQGVKSGTPEMDICAKQEISRENSRRNRARRAADSTVICNQVGTAMVCT
jgi:hypothetical protein